MRTAGHLSPLRAGRRAGSVCQDKDDFLQTLTFEPASLDDDATFTWNLQPIELEDMEKRLRDPTLATARADLVEFWKADHKADLK